MREIWKPWEKEGGCGWGERNLGFGPLGSNNDGDLKAGRGVGGSAEPNPTRSWPSMSQLKLG